MKHELSKKVGNSSFPPDGGWGWMIVMASFVCNVIAEGTIYSFGVFLPKLIRHFEEGKSEVAWIGSLLCGVHMAIGPFGSALITKYGCRVTCITGSVIAMVSFALSSLCNSLILLAIIYGIFGGIGLGLIYIPTVVCVGQYFDKKRPLAIGITTCGAGFGSIIMAPFSAFLLDRFDWRGANLIFAGIIFNCAIFGSLMRPLKLPKQKQHQGKINFGCDTIKDIDQVEIANNSDNDVEKKVKAPLVNFRLLKNPVFLLISVSYIIANMGFLVPYVYFIDVAISKDIGYKEASILVSIIGITNTVGRILSGVISSLPTVNSLTVIYICTGISGVAIVCVPFCSNYIGFALVAAIFGLFTSPLIALASIVLVKLVGISQLADAIGLFLLMISVSAIVGAPIAGLLFDSTQSYKWTFWLAGALLLFSSILFVISYLVWRYFKRNEQQASEHRNDSTAVPS